MKKVLVVGDRNTMVSQMFEEFVRMYGDGEYIVESAGMDPVESVDASTIEVLKEEGLDLTGKTTNNVFDLYNAGMLYDYVITVSAKAAAECPVFPGFAHRRHFSLANHSGVSWDRAENSGLLTSGKKN